MKTFTLSVKSEVGGPRLFLVCMWAPSWRVLCGLHAIGRFHLFSCSAALTYLAFRGRRGDSWVRRRIGESDFENTLRYSGCVSKKCGLFSCFNIILLTNLRKWYSIFIYPIKIFVDTNPHSLSLGFTCFR